MARLRDAISRLVLVIGRHPDEEVALVSLVSNEVEFATEYDVRIEPEETGLAYPVLVETDLVGPVYESQLNSALGRLPEALSFLADPEPDLAGVEELRRGLPYSGLADTRLAWKRSELGDLHQLASERLAVLAGPVEEEATLGPAELVQAREAVVAYGVSVSVDAFDETAPPLLRWHKNDAEASAVAAALAREIDHVRPSLRALAIADARADVHRGIVWEIDRALAALEVARSLPEGARAVLDTYVSQGVIALRGLLGLTEWLDPALVVTCLDEVDPLRRLLDELGQRKFEEARKRAHVWAGAEAFEDVLVARQSGAGQRVVALAPDLVIHDLVEAKMVGLLSADASDIATASVWLSARATEAARVWEQVQELSPESAERHRAEILWEAVTGRSGPLTLWLQVVDRETGEPVDAFPLTTVTRDDDRRAELSGEVPVELLDPHRTTAVFVTRRPNRSLDAASLTSYLLVAAVAAPEATVSFAEAMTNELPEGELHEILVAAIGLGETTARTVGERILRELVVARRRWADQVAGRLRAADTAADSDTAIDREIGKSTMAALRRIRRELP